MRILVATGVYPPEAGGPGKHTVMMEQELPKHGFEVDVLPFRRVRAYPVIVRNFLYLFLLIYKSLRADIIFAQDTGTVALPAAVASFITRAKLVVRVPGDYVWEQGRQRFGVKESLDDFQNTRYSFRIELMRKLSRWSVRRAALVIAPSKYLGEIVNGWLPAGKKSRVIYNGIALPVVTQMPDDQPAGPIILYFGRLVAWKGVAGIIDAAKDEAGWQVVIIGNGPEEDALRGRVASYGMEDRVRFIDALPNPEALGWASAADVFVLNSSYEGLSHTLIEVMSLSTPIVATDIPGNREVIRDGVHGVLVPVGNTQKLHHAIYELLHEKERAKRLAENATERAHMFDITHTSKQLATALKEVRVP